MFRALAAVALLMLAACGGAENIYADNSAVDNARYSSSAPPSVTLYTIINMRSGAGAHSALLVNASEFVLFDPAGSFKVSFMPERGDVLYGASPRGMAAYSDYHARETHFVRSQTLQLPASTAEQILALVKANGAVAKANCARSITSILRAVPGFENIGTTYFPKALEADFALNPNTVHRTVTDATSDKSHGVRFIDKNDTAAIAAAGLAP
jgi:hypothetical protein